MMADDEVASATPVVADEGDRFDKYPSVLDLLEIGAMLLLLV